MKYLIAFILLVSAVACKDQSPVAEDPIYFVTGRVSGDTVENISVFFRLGDTLQTNSNGEFTYYDHPSQYEVMPIATGVNFIPSSITVSTLEGDVSEVNFTSVFISEPNPSGYSFQSFNPDVFEAIEIDDVTFRLNLTQNAIWYHNSQAGLYYVELEADFIVTAAVSAQKRSNNGENAECNVCLGGIMARNPDNSGGENYVHIVVGVNPVGVGVETKNTMNGVSEYTPADDGSAAYEIQMERNGSTFILSKRAIGQSEWQVAATYDRPDLPQVVQVGMNIYTSVNGAEVADLSILFEDFEIFNDRAL